MASYADNISDPQSLLPDQYFSGDARLPGLDGERKLMLAVLEDAVLVAQKYALARDPERRRELADARAWIAERDKTWPFSFENICNVLGIDPEYVRYGLDRASHRAGDRAQSTAQISEPKIVPLTERLAAMAKEALEPISQAEKLRIAS